MSTDLLAAFIAFAFVMSGTPGPNVMLVLASGVNHGFRATIPHMLGITIGFSVMLLAIGFGLGQVFAAFPALYTVLKVVSVVYLSWLAWKLASAAAIEVAAGEAAGRPMTFLEGAAFQWVNPKAWAICLSVVAAYTIPTQFLASIMTAATLFLAINLLCVAVWTAFGVALKRILQNRRWLRIFNITMALLLVASLIPLLLDRNP